MARHYKTILRPGPLPLAVLTLLMPLLSNAEEMQDMPQVTVTDKAPPKPFGGTTTLDRTTIDAKRAATDDTASLLRDVPGVSLYGNGGISSLPAIHGLADDRLRIQLDGMDLMSACPNHMNPVLSYIDPSNVGLIRVYAGITPVSVGGDSIGGAIVVESALPEFAENGEKSLTKGEIGGGYRSNGDAVNGHLNATYATDWLSLNYAGSIAKADNYDAGGDFKDYRETGRPGHTLPRDEVGSTAYETHNDQLSVAVRGTGQLLEAKFGAQHIPYELYPNQRMDMLDNDQRRINLRYLGQFGWGKLEASAYHEKVDHYMNFGDDKQYIYGAPPGVVAPGMPMNTRSNNTGAKLMASLDLAQADVLRLGGEYQRYRLDDWWPPSPASLAGMLDNQGQPATMGGMAPDTFENINDGKRDRASVFSEWERHFNPRWMTLIGARYERVTTDAGEVQGYNMMMYDPGAFNASDRSKTDNNWNVAAIARYTPDDTRSVEFGYSMKTRSPNLYERYTWSTSMMAQEMNNFVGDGNGYFGDPDLKHETAHTLSATLDWHTPDKAWEFKATPYYTRVHNYIDAEQWNDMANAPAAMPLKDQFVILRYTNESARLYGVDLSGKMPIADTAAGAFGLTGQLSYTKGENRDTHDGLYNVMPLNAKVAFTHALGAWGNALEVVMVDRKDDVSDVRNEIETPGFTLVNLRSSYTWKQVRLDLGVENLFDKLYYLPLGGAYLGQGATMSFNREINNASLWGTGVPGLGRSVYTAVTVKF
jgi:iron complex outermembrane receptor protein